MTQILIIEDILDNAELMQRMLHSGGYQTLHAPDAETGLQMAQTHHPDLILLDLGLPDYDGQTLAGWLLADPQTAPIPLVACTAWPLETARQMAESYGCAGYISKPITNLKQFLAQIASFLPKP